MPSEQEVNTSLCVPMRRLMRLLCLFSLLSFVGIIIIWFASLFACAKYFASSYGLVVNPGHLVVYYLLGEARLNCTTGLEIIPQRGELKDAAFKSIGFQLVWNTFDERFTFQCHFLSVLLISAACYALSQTICYFMAKRSRKATCSKCGYMLVGNVSGRCPECGTPIRMAKGGQATLI